VHEINKATYTLSLRERVYKWPNYFVHVPKFGKNPNDYC